MHILSYIYIKIFFIIFILGSFFSERGMYECSKIIYHCVDIVDLNGNIDHNLLAITFEVALR